MSSESTKVSTNTLDTPSYWREYPDRDIEYVRWYPCEVGPLSEKDMFKKKPFVFYLHVPFCNNICLCCPYNKFSTHGPLVNKYVDALKKEIINYASRPYIQNGEFIAGYFGGGTPTSLSNEHLEEILKLLFERLDFKKGSTVTVETTPNEMDEKKAATLISNNVDRISMGVQSFDDTLLRRIGRTHTGNRVKDVVSLLRKTGFKQICIDLMYGLPGQTMQQWKDSIDTFLSLNVETISLYLYLVIPSSIIFQKIQRGAMPPCPEKSLQDEMYKYAVNKLLSAGYYAVTTTDFGKDSKSEEWLKDGVEVYELGPKGYRGVVVSTFPPASHVSHTWYMCGDMLTLGSGAYGFLNDHMFLNEPDINKYIARLEAGELPIVMGTYVPPSEKMARSMVLGSKLLKIHRKDFIDKHGVDMVQVFGPQIKKLEGLGLIKMTEEALEVTYPKGWYYMDNISKTFYSPKNYGLPQPAPNSATLLKFLKPK